MEQQKPSAETQQINHGELEHLAAERLKHIENSSERQTNRHEAVEAAREQLKQTEQIKPAVENTPKAEPAHRIVLTKAANYRQTMVSLRHRMKPAARQFSTVIHNRAVEATSEVVGKTVLRPSISLGATTTAVFITGFLYIYARHYGFALRGSEMLITLVIGGVIGLLIEAAAKATRLASGRSTR